MIFTTLGLTLTVSVKPRVVKIMLKKSKRGLWPRMTLHKYAWIRRDSELGSGSDSDSGVREPPTQTVCVH